MRRTATDMAQLTASRISRASRKTADFTQGAWSSAVYRDLAPAQGKMLWPQPAISNVTNRQRAGGAITGHYSSGPGPSICGPYFNQERERLRFHRAGGIKEWVDAEGPAISSLTIARRGLSVRPEPYGDRIGEGAPRRTGTVEISEAMSARCIYGTEIGEA